MVSVLSTLGGINPSSQKRKAQSLPETAPLDSGHPIQCEDVPLRELQDLPRINGVRIRNAVERGQLLRLQTAVISDPEQILAVYHRVIPSASGRRRRGHRPRS